MCGCSNIERNASDNKVEFYQDGSCPERENLWVLPRRRLPRVPSTQSTLFQAMQHFYGSFALVFQICVRRGALELFGLNDDELLPDLHITRAGVFACRTWGSPGTRYCSADRK